VTERADLIPTMMDEGSVDVGRQIDVKLPASEVVWLETLEYAT
jgi:hypothetical protein